MLDPLFELHASWKPSMRISVFGTWLNKYCYCSGDVACFQVFLLITSQTHVDVHHVGYFLDPIPFVYVWNIYPIHFGFFLCKSREIYQSHGFFGDDSTPIKPSRTQGRVAGVWVASERSSGCKHWSPRPGYVWRWTHFVISAWNIVDFLKGWRWQDDLQ